MNKFKLLLLSFICIQISAFCQIHDIKNIELPLEINVFSDLASTNNYTLKEYNQTVNIGKGYIDSKGKFHKATGIYSTKEVVRMHEKLINGKYEHYHSTDSVKVGFIGQVKLSNCYDCILVKIEDIPNEYQKSYFYKLLSFNKNKEHLSTIKVFELIDDASTKDWMEEKPLPNVTSKIMQDGSIIIKWDEGYNEYYIQHVKLNAEGMFIVERLEEVVK
ncbi:hypothetical protein [Labilibacter marinus]|uniref:hypothetical protein n=1 Tax=Labilibacter marinus TaxID=1477105 RepID=UPI00082AC368|nr:hypothetical protein [Labilibacter marinus]